jgi:hypothetical protein
MSESTAIVVLLLARAGLRAHPDEIAALVHAYDVSQAAVESLYAVQAARYESPALVFQPNPTFVDWA